MQALRCPTLLPFARETRLGCGSVARRYFVTTFGCQMNAHDSERIKGLLEELGLGEAPSAERGRRRRLQHLHDPREARHEARRLPRRGGGAEAPRSRSRDRGRRLLRGGSARAHLRALPGRRRRVRARVDRAPRRVARRRRGWASRAGGSGSTSASSPPRCRCTANAPFQAWVQVSMGCNSACSYCIVPAVRGREQSRRPGEIVAEVTRLAAEGVREITLLGQNVNSWGRDLAPELDTEFGELLRACDAVEGIERIRFTSPHPKDFRDPVIAAIAECDAVCEHIHLPLQSGSSRILKAMRRTYTRERYLDARRASPRRDPRSRARHRHHRRLPRRDRRRLPRDARGRRGGRLRQRLHVRLLAAPGHRGRGDARSGARTR